MHASKSSAPVERACRTRTYYARPPPAPGGRCGALHPTSCRSGRGASGHGVRGEHTCGCLSSSSLIRATMQLWLLRSRGDRAGIGLPSRTDTARGRVGRCGCGSTTMPDGIAGICMTDGTGDDGLGFGSVVLDPRDVRQQRATENPRPRARRRPRHVAHCVWRDTDEPWPVGNSDWNGVGNQPPTHRTANYDGFLSYT